MTPDTFWKIFLRIFGLYLIWQTLTIVPSFFATVMYYINTKDQLSIFNALWAIVFIALFFIAIIRYCLFKTDRTIAKLRLTRGLPEDTIEVNIHRSSLLSIAVIVLGGVMLADGLPSLLYNIFDYIQREETALKFTENRATPYLIANLLKVVIGYFMMSDNRLVVNFIERKRRTFSGPVED